MTTPTRPGLERPAFFDGQLLEAADLGTLYDYQREVRWLHNRTLHSWGIAFGFDVEARKGGREIRISSGYGLDCAGHDIVLSSAVTLPVPPVAQSSSGGPRLYYVTASYAADDELPPEESRAGVCGNDGAVRRREAAQVRLQDPADVLTTENRYRVGLDLILAAIQVERCVLAADASTAGRRVARVETHPFVAAGTTPSGATVWRLHPEAGVILGVEALVDTSAAGFRTTPSYVAHVVGGRLLDGVHIVEGFPEVHDASATGFTLRVLLPRHLFMPPYSINPDVMLTPDLPNRLRTALHWRVVWLGVEQ